TAFGGRSKFHARRPGGCCDDHGDAAIQLTITTTGGTSVMVVVTRTRGLGTRGLGTRGLGAAVMLSVGTLWPSLSQADQRGAAYPIPSPGTLTAGFVTTDSVSIQITGPSSEAIRHAKLTLNGRNVTLSLSRDGAGVVSGLQVGSNTFLLFESNGRDPVARLVIERATTPAVACASLA